MRLQSDFNSSLILKQEKALPHDIHDDDIHDDDIHDDYD